MSVCSSRQISVGQGVPSESDFWLARDGLGDALIRHGGAAIEKAASGEEFGVEQGGAGGAAD
jgi:hypothetical protein